MHVMIKILHTHGALKIQESPEHEHTIFKGHKCLQYDNVLTGWLFLL